MSRRTFRGSGKNLLEQFPEHLRITPVHGIGERRYRHCGHSEVIQPIMIRHQSTFNFTQRILSGDLSIKTGQELLPCRKRLAIMVPGQVFYGFFKTISGNEVEKLLKDAIVIHCRISYAHLRILGTFNIAQNPTLTINPGNFYRTVVMFGCRLKMACHDPFCRFGISLPG